MARKRTDPGLVLIVKPGGKNNINGEKIVRLVRRKLNNEPNVSYDQENDEWLLGHQDQIPAKFRKFYLNFKGKVWRRGSEGYSRDVSCLCWSGGRWILYTGFDFDFEGRFRRSRKSR